MKVRKLGISKNYVYDASVNSIHQNFYGNGFLLHNTDSSYFTFKGTPVESIEDMQRVAEVIVEKVNQSFPLFMKSHFNVDEDNCVIEASLETVGRRGYFASKKKYAVYCDNTKDESKKLKIKGIDVVRADSSPLVRDFFVEIIREILEHGVDDLERYKEKIMRKYKELLETDEPWLLGSPTSVQDPEEYWVNYTVEDPRVPEEERDAVARRYDLMFGTMDDEKSQRRKNIYGAYNWNVMAKYVYKDPSVPLIKSGDRIVVCKIKDDGVTGVWVAYPSDIEELPEWFKSLPFDKEQMVESIFLKKLESIFPKEVIPEFHFIETSDSGSKDEEKCNRTFWI